MRRFADTGRLAAALLAAAGLAAMGCGGGDDREEAEQAVRDFVEAATEKDADRLCDELLTDEFIERSTGSPPDRAGDACKQELGAITGLRLKLVRIEKTDVTGDRATVTVVLRAQGKRRVQKLLLEKENGDWKLAGSR